MQKIFKIIGFHVVIMILAIGCASSQNMGAKGNQYQVRLGISTQNTLAIETPRILNRYDYEIVRDEANFNDIFYETRWKRRAPLEDEIQIGVKQANTRLIIRATPRTLTNSSGATLYKVTLFAENQYQNSETDEWRPSPFTDQAKKKIDEIGSAFKTEFQVKGLNN